MREQNIETESASITKRLGIGFSQKNQYINIRTGMNVPSRFRAKEQYFN